MPRGIGLHVLVVEPDGAEDRNETDTVVLCQYSASGPKSATPGQHNLQESNAQQKQETGSLRPRNRHGRDGGNGQHEDHEVGNDVEVGQGPPDGDGMAVALYLAMPVLLEGDAEGQVHADAPEVVDDDDAEDAPDGDAQVVVCLEQAEVQE